MQLLSMLRKLDDLAEVVVFHVLLRTPARRRAAGVLFFATAFVAYVFSGFLLAPAPLPTSFIACDSSFAPQPGLPGLAVDLVNEISVNGEVKASQFLELELVLQDLREVLDLQVDPARMRHQSAWIRTAGSRMVSDIGRVLVARGILRSQSSLGDMAVVDWLAACRLGRILMASANDPQTREEHRNGAYLEEVALRALRSHAISGAMTGAQAIEVLGDLDTRRNSMATLGDCVRAGARQLDDVIAGYARSNELPRRYRGLRFYLPALAWSRTDAAARMSTVIEDEFEHVAQALDHGRIPDAPVADTVLSIGNWRIHVSEKSTWTDRLLSLVSSARGAELSGRLLAMWNVPHVRHYARYCQLLDRDAQSLRHLCAARMVQCSPITLDIDLEL